MRWSSAIPPGVSPPPPGGPGAGGGGGGVGGDPRRDSPPGGPGRGPPARPRPPGARVAADFAVPAAGIARVRAHQLPERRARHAAELAGATTALAGLDRRAGLGAVAVAVLAGVDGVVLDGHLSAMRGVDEGYPDGYGNVAALRRTARASTEGAAERIAAAEERVEDVRERAEASEAGLEPARAEALVAVAVEDRAALGVGQNLVGLRRLLEFLLGLGIVPIHVRVKLARELAEGLLDRLLVRVAGDAEDGVWVALCRCHLRKRE